MSLRRLGYVVIILVGVFRLYHIRTTILSFFFLDNIEIPLSSSAQQHHVSTNKTTLNSPNNVAQESRKNENNNNIEIPSAAAHHGLIMTAHNNDTNKTLLGSSTRMETADIHDLSSSTVSHNNIKQDFVTESSSTNENNTSKNENTTAIVHNECELPSCDLVLKSRIYSERCNKTQINRWPLLVTGTPRSATVYVSELLKNLGLEIENDWYWERKHGRVSWIFAFEDDHPVFERKVKDGKLRFHRGEGKYQHILHQIKEPVKSITSMCSEPILIANYSNFLKRHGNMSSLVAHENDPIRKERVVLQFWVEWHRFLKQMKFPTYQVEHVDAMHVAQLAHLDKFVNFTSTKNVRKDVNKRKHRDTFTWQQLYTIDPEYAAEAWQLAHYYNYSYPDVDFDSLTCMDYITDCEGKNKTNTLGRCPPGTHPFPRDAKKIELLPKPAAMSGLKGWVDDGCIERKLHNDTFVGEIGTKRLHMHSQHS